MGKLSLGNMAFGFWLVVYGSIVGIFLSFEESRAILYQPENLHSWQMSLFRSVHGHTNLFGMLHVLLGLTLPYSKWSEKTKKFQSIGLGLGSLAMGCLLWVKYLSQPSDQLDLLGGLLGLCLSLALVALLSHTVGLLAKINRV